MAQGLSGSDRRRAYAETRELGRRFGLRDGDMPSGLDDFRAWYEEIVDHRLADSPTVRDFLGVVRRPVAPPHVPAILWPGAQALFSRVSWLVTVGTLPGRARDVLGIPWGRADREQMRLVFAALPLSGATPARWRYLAPARRGFDAPQQAAGPDARFSTSAAALPCATSTSRMGESEVQVESGTARSAIG